MAWSIQHLVGRPGNFSLQLAAREEGCPGKTAGPSPGHRIHREKGLDLFWPDSPPDTASTNLRKALHFARRAPGEYGLLALKNAIIILAPGQELQIEVEIFELAPREAFHKAERLGHISDKGLILPSFQGDNF